jgi:hypothetical protein
MGVCCNGVDEENVPFFFAAVKPGDARVGK